ncbi:hypothetical protein [Methanobrevibacter sp.]|uniref:hypothetical protein n=1 Tax=Methanobrevibacter sp. TaxID=66852 RepID=UPI00388E9667
MKELTINPFDRKSILKVNKYIQEKKATFKAKETELLSRLAFMGATRVSIRFSQAIYGDDHDVVVSTLLYDNQAVIKAQGEDVCFIEFGSGIKYGYGHPKASEFGFGPSTWSEGPMGSGYWDNQKGWWYKGKDGKGHHSYGNPPAMAMYKTKVELAEEINTIAREVFKW